MKKIHKIASMAILLATVFITFFFKVQMTDATTKNLVTFFSLVFGFYMASIAILYNSTSLLLSSGLFGIAVLNIFFMVLLIHTIIDGMIEEARKWRI